MTKEHFRILDIGAGNSGFLMSLLLTNIPFFIHILKTYGRRTHMIAGDMRFQTCTASLHFMRIISFPLSQVLASVRTIQAFYENFLNVKDLSLNMVTLNSYCPLLGEPNREDLKKSSADQLNLAAYS